MFVMNLWKKIAVQNKEIQEAVQQHGYCQKNKEMCLREKFKSHFIKGDR